MSIDKQKEIFNILNRVTDAINQSPLMEKLSHLVEIKTAIVGGAVRDAVLDKPIKDIDICIGLNFKNNLKIVLPEKNVNSRMYFMRDYDSYSDEMEYASAESQALDVRNKEILDLLKKPEFSIIHDVLFIDKEISSIQAVTLLIQRILENHEDYSIQKVFDQNTIPINKKQLNASAYEVIGLSAVVAIEDKHSEYPIELLFSPEPPDWILTVFDFNLCKIHMLNDNGNMKIIPTAMFEDDQKNKTMTYTPKSSVDEDKVNKSLVVRYGRLQKKYPEYELVFSPIFSMDKEITYFIEQTMKTVKLYHELNNLSKSSSNAINKVNKI